ncbi:serine hydrolase domain-containing protein [Natrialbaceae archaeon A-arb3/5]
MSRRPSRRRVLAGSALLGMGTLASRSGDVAAEPDSASSNGATESGRTSDVAYSSDATYSSRQDVAEIDLESLDSFVDERMETLLDEHDVVGASVAVVHDDAVELARGYGDAADGGSPVDPAETAFRISSVSKPLVWTAVSQLIEDGRIDPDEDVRTSLESVSIPETYTEPITIAHLATHTAGFEERFRGTWVTDPAEMRPLAEVLEEEQPERVRPPGEIASYSNYGTALAAQVVADVTGTAFPAYADEHLLEPLEMTTTTFEQPVPDEVDVATGYTSSLGSVQEAPELLLEIGPAGAAATTASDMARFMRAQLADGAVDGERILAAETVDEMHEQWFTHHDAVPGIAFGLLEDERRGVRVLEHNGAIPGSFYSHLLFVPEYDLGLFLAYNTNTGAAANAEFLDSFAEEFFPDRTPEASAEPSSEPDGRPEQAAALEGTYRGVRIAESTHARFSSTLQAGTAEVSVDEDGFLVTDFGGGPTRWIERESFVFDEVDGTDTLAFREEAGEITHLFVGFQAFERIGRHESLSAHGTVAGVAALGLFSGAIGWPLGWAKRRLVDDGSSPDADPGREADGATSANPEADGASSANPDTEGRTESNAEQAESAASNTNTETTAAATSGSEPGPNSDRGLVRSLSSEARARWVAGGTIAALFGFVLGTVTLLFVHPYTLLSRPPLAYELVSILPILGLVGTVVAAGYAVVAWRDGYWGRLSRLHYTLVVASAAAFCWLLYYWNFFRIPL